MRRMEKVHPYVIQFVELVAEDAGFKLTVSLRPAEQSGESRQKAKRGEIQNVQSKTGGKKAKPSVSNKT